MYPARIIIIAVTAIFVVGAAYTAGHVEGSKAGIQVGRDQQKEYADEISMSDSICRLSAAARIQEDKEGKDHSASVSILKSCGEMRDSAKRILNDKGF